MVRVWQASATFWLNKFILLSLFIVLVIPFFFSYLSTTIEVVRESGYIRQGERNNRNPSWSENEHVRWCGVFLAIHEVVWFGVLERWRGNKTRSLFRDRSRVCL